MRRKNARWMYRIVRDSKHNDKFRGRTDYDPADYIDTETLVHLQQAQQNKCNWCGVFMDWMERRSNPRGLTVDRLDNALPHIKTNVVLACKRCNSKNCNRERSLLRKYFYRWYRNTFDVKVQYKETGRHACIS